MATEPIATDHRTAAAEEAARRPIGCAVLTVSDTRTDENDAGGRRARDILSSAGYLLRDRLIVKDDAGAIGSALENWLSRSDIDAIITTGGTGIAKRDTTIEVVRRRLTLELEGFGELFRMLSWPEVGAAAMLSRAVAGLVIREPQHGGETFIFTIPGSLNAVETAMTKLVAPELQHLVWERAR